MKTKRREAPAWVFSWRRLGEPALPKLIAWGTVTAAFAILLGTVRIRTPDPSPWAVRRGSLIQVLDDADGRALTLRAREGGPFPSRFEPSEWAAYQALDKAALDAARAPLPPYSPQLRQLAAETRPLTPLAQPGIPVLPDPPTMPPPAVATEKLRLAPVIRSLAGIPASALPQSPPPFDATVDATAAAEATRFLVRLDSSGHVIDCVSLDGGDESGSSALEDWLRRLSFQPDHSKPVRWAALAVAFTNQKAPPAPADAPETPADGTLNGDPNGKSD